MKYIYVCDQCQKIVEINKPMSEASKEERCECGEVMKRIYNSVGIKTNDGIKTNG